MCFYSTKGGVAKCNTPFFRREKPSRGRAGTAGDSDVADGERVLPHDKAYDFFPVTYKGMLSKEHDRLMKEKLPGFENEFRQ